MDRYNVVFTRYRGLNKNIDSVLISVFAHSYGEAYEKALTEYKNERRSVAMCYKVCMTRVDEEWTK